MNREELVQATLEDLQRRTRSLERSVGRLQRMETAGMDQVLSVFLSLPALRGLWPFTSMGDGGAGIDISGQGRALTNNNNVDFSHSDNIGHAAFTAASSHYFSRADEAGLDILGNEAYVASAIQGITMGGWFWFNSIGSIMPMMSKYVEGAQISYRLYKLSNNRVQFGTSANGSSLDAVSSGDAPDLIANAWYFCVGRSPNGAEQSVFVNNVESIGSNGTFPIFSSTSPLEIGHINISTFDFYLDGRAALCFICAAAVPNDRLAAVFKQTRGFFGV